MGTRYFKSIVVFVVVAGPLSKDRGVAEDHETAEVGQLPRAWTRGCRETESRKRVSGAKNPQQDNVE